MRDHAREFPAGRAERITLVSAGFAEAESGGGSVGHGAGATQADDLTAFAFDLLAKAAEVVRQPNPIRGLYI